MVFGMQYHRKVAKNTLNIEIDLSVASSARNLQFSPFSLKKYFKKDLFCSENVVSKSLVPQFQFKEQISESLVLSHFNFGDVLYGPCLKTQNFCCRLILGLRKYYHISCLSYTLFPFYVSIRCILLICIFVLFVYKSNFLLL